MSYFIEIGTVYHSFQVLNQDAKPSPVGVAFCGTELLWNTSFTWTANGDVQGNNGLFTWEFMSKGSVPSHGHIAQCTFGY